MNRKILAVLLAVVTVFSMLALAACGKDSTKTDDGKKDSDKEIKVGFIFLHDENSTYDLNFINAADEALKNLGFKETQFIYKFPRVRSALRQQRTWLTRSALSSSQTPSVTRTT